MSAGDNGNALPVTDLVHTVSSNTPAIVDLVLQHGNDVTNGSSPANNGNGSGPAKNVNVSSTNNNGNEGKDQTDAKPDNQMEDEGDAWGFGGSRASAAGMGPRMPVERDSEVYNMNHKKRGVAFIFNHMEFDDRLGLKPRNGTNADRDNLRTTLRGLDFEVRVYDDLTVKDVDRLLEEAAHEDHSDEDCIFIAVLSHGELNILYGSDHAYKPDRLWSHFTAEKCPTLAGKPKLFFIQACQGDQLDMGVRLQRATTVTDSNAMSYKIPSHADFLIAYSTIPGFYSWRNTSAGSWFVQALCHVLQREGSTRDLLSIMTRVTRKVALDFQSNTPGDYMMHEKKQIPCITSMLTRDLYFTRKRMSV